MKSKIITIISIIIFILILIIIAIFFNKNQSDVNINEEEESKVEITSQNFEKEVLNSDKTVLIDFYADWCGPCKMLAPIIEEVAKENEQVKVLKINVDDEQDLAMKYQVMSIPTVVIIKNGEEVNRSVGLVSKSQILDLIK